MNTTNLCPVGGKGTSQIVQRISSTLLTAASALVLNHQGILTSPYIKSALETHEAEFEKLLIREIFTRIISRYLIALENIECPISL